MAIEEAAYKVLKTDDKFEIREYAPHVLAETIVDGDLEEAGNKASGGSSTTSPEPTGRAPRWP